MTNQNPATAQIPGSTLDMKVTVGDLVREALDRLAEAKNAGESGHGFAYWTGEQIVLLVEPDKMVATEQVSERICGNEIGIGCDIYPLAADLILEDGPPLILTDDVIRRLRQLRQRTNRLDCSYGLATILPGFCAQFFRPQDDHLYITFTTNSDVSTRVAFARLLAGKFRYPLRIDIIDGETSICVTRKDSEDDIRAKLPFAPPPDPPGLASMLPLWIEQLDELRTLLTEGMAGKPLSGVRIDVCDKDLTYRSPDGSMICQLLYGQSLHGDGSGK